MTNKLNKLFVRVAGVGAAISTFALAMGTKAVNQFADQITITDTLITDIREWAVSTQGKLLALGMVLFLVAYVYRKVTKVAASKQGV